LAVPSRYKDWRTTLSGRSLGAMSSDLTRSTELAVVADLFYLSSKKERNDGGEPRFRRIFTFQNGMKIESGWDLPVAGSLRPAAVVLSPGGAKQEKASRAVRLYGPHTLVTRNEFHSFQRRHNRQNPKHITRKRRKKRRHHHPLLLHSACARLGLCNRLCASLSEVQSLSIKRERLTESSCRRERKRGRH